MLGRAIASTYFEVLSRTLSLKTRYLGPIAHLLKDWDTLGIGHRREDVQTIESSRPFPRCNLKGPHTLRALKL